MAAITWGPQQRTELRQHTAHTRAAGDPDIQRLRAATAHQHAHPGERILIVPSTHTVPLVPEGIWHGIDCDVAP